jgi:hypothetical protein
MPLTTSLLVLRRFSRHPLRRLRHQLLGRWPPHIAPLTRRHISQIPLLRMLRKILQLLCSFPLFNTLRQTHESLSVLPVRMPELPARLTLTRVSETRVDVGRRRAGECGRRGLIHFLVVEVGVGLEGVGGRGGACGEDLGVEFGNGVVADEFTGLVLCVC